MRIERRFTKSHDTSTGKEAYDGLELASQQIGHAFAAWPDGLLQAITRLPVPRPVTTHEGLPWLQASFSLIVGVAHLESMVSWWTVRGWESGFFDSEQDAQNFYDECRFIMASGMLYADRAHWLAASIQKEKHTLWRVDVEQMKIVVIRDHADYRRLLVRGGSGRNCPVLWLNMKAFELFPEDERARYVQHVVKLAVMAQEISVHHAALPSAEQARQSFAHRPLGLGVMAHAKGGAAGHYERSLVQAIAYGVSAEIAELLGAYPAFEKDKARVMSAMKSWQADARSIDAKKVSEDRLAELYECWEKAETLGQHAGYRHCQILEADVPPCGIKAKAFTSVTKKAREKRQAQTA